MVCPRFWGDLKVKGIKPKEILTFFGAITVRRQYGYCTRCKKGDFPDDRCLGPDGSGLSPEVKRLSSVLRRAGLCPGSDLLWEASRIRLPARQLQWAAESLGEEIAQRGTEEVTPDHRPVPYGRTVDIGMDGTGIPMQSCETEVFGESRTMLLQEAGSEDVRHPGGQPREQREDPRSRSRIGELHRRH